MKWNRFIIYAGVLSVVIFSSLNAIADTADSLKQQIEQKEAYQCEGTAGYPKCKNDLDDLKAQYAKAVTEEAAAKKTLDAESDACANNGYKECYRGIKWGALVDNSVLQAKCPRSFGLSEFKPNMECDKSFSSPPLKGLEYSGKFKKGDGL